MSNNLRKMVESINSEFICSGDLTVEQSHHVSELALNAAERAICFYAGDFDAYDNFKVVNDLVRLPYDVCWVEFDINKSDHFCVMYGALMWNIGGKINGQMWGRFKGKWCYIFCWVKETPEKMNVGHHDLELMHDAIATLVCRVELFLTVLNCKNVIQKQHEPDKKLQSARARRGKKPLFSFWTLEVRKERKESRHLGGTHESPRVHLCRGHIKVRKTGSFWWQPQIRGNKKNGMVHKDYELK